MLPPKVDKVQVPFEEYSNLIVIPVSINNKVTLKFILDSGAESTILTEKLFADLIGLTLTREITIQAPGLIDSLSAYVASNVQLSLPGGIEGNGLNVLVLKEDYLELSENLGEKIYGIIGYDLFHRFVTEIDYSRRVVTFHRPSSFEPPRKSSSFQLKVEGTKPFMHSVITQDDRQDTVKLLVDTGASHAILLDVSASENLILPEKMISSRLGQGLGGEIPGFVGRMDAVNLGAFCFEEVLVSIPVDGAYVKAIKRGSRDGTLGGELLSRFYVAIDYQRERIYLKRNSQYTQPFEFDMSGLSIASTGKELKELVVQHVRKNSPAHFAGIQAGDQILKINNQSLYNTKLSSLNVMLRRDEGYRIKIVILRDGEKLKKEFRLRRMI